MYPKDLPCEPSWGEMLKLIGKQAPIMIADAMTQNTSVRAIARSAAARDAITAPQRRSAVARLISMRAWRRTASASSVVATRGLSQ